MAISASERRKHRVGLESSATEVEAGEQARAKRRERIRRAVGAGVSIADAAEWAGVSRAAVYQMVEGES